MQKRVPLTKHEKLHVYRACEALEIGEETYSCNALVDFSDMANVFKITNSYSKFYNKDKEDSWLENSYQGSISHEELKPIRIILLLLFAEVGKIEEV